MIPTERDPLAILASAIEEHKPVAVFACFSGGHDSLVSTHWAMEHAPALIGDVPLRVLHINTGIGIEATRVFVRETCAGFGWPLWERHAAEGEYERFVHTHGFPGPAQHPRMYQRLKERVVYAVCKEVKTARMQRVMFLTGIRHDESTIRAGYRRAVSKVRAQVWVNPLYWQGRPDFDAYRAAHRLPESRVKALYGHSGECLCGAFADHTEAATLRRHFPEDYARIEALEVKAKAAGMPWGWADAGPPDWWRREKQGQMPLVFNPLCHGCGKNADPTEILAVP